MESVTSKTAKTSFWTAVERFFSLGVNFVVQLILARLLMPSDFGVVAMLTVFIGISQAVSECGLTNALIRKQDCSEEDHSTAFLMNILLSILLYILLFFSSSGIASFYDMPLVCPLLRIYSLVFVFDALRIVPYAKLCKRLEFNKIAIISSSSVIISGILGIWVAHQGYGAWALIWQVLSYSIFYFFFIIIAERWFPVFVFNKKSFHYLWSFGSKMLLTGIISRIYSNIYSLLIGKYYNSSLLGLFNNGQRYAQFYPYFVESVFVKNSLPILSQYQNDDVRLRELYRNFIVLVCFITFPVCLLMFALAKPIILLILTEKWAGAIPYFQLFAIGSLLIPANTINLNMLQVKARTDYTLKAEIIKKSIGFLLVFTLLPFGTIYMAFGCCMMALVAYSINVYYARKVLGVSLRVQIIDLLKVFMAAVISVSLGCISFLIVGNDIVIILLCCLICGLSYFVITRYVLKYSIYDKLSSYILKRC